MCIRSATVFPKLIFQVGMSSDQDFNGEIEKARTASTFGVDIISDCSTGGNIEAFQRSLNQIFPHSVSSVPIYEYTKLQGFDYANIDFPTGKMLVR